MFRLLSVQSVRQLRPSFFTHTREFSASKLFDKMRQNILTICGQYKNKQTTSINEIIHDIEAQIKNLDEHIDGIEIHLNRKYRPKDVINAAQLFTENYQVELYEQDKKYTIYMKDPSIEDLTESRAHWVMGPTKLKNESQASHGIKV